MTDNLRSLTDKYQDLEESYSELHVQITIFSAQLHQSGYQTTCRIEGSCEIKLQKKKKRKGDYIKDILKYKFQNVYLI